MESCPGESGGGHARAWGGAAIVVIVVTSGADFIIFDREGRGCDIIGRKIRGKNNTVFLARKFIFAVFFS